MRVTLTIVADVDPVGFSAYDTTYPEFAGEMPHETLAREAIATWEGLSLLADPRPVVTFEPDTLAQTWRPKHEL